MKYGEDTYEARTVFVLLCKHPLKLEIIFHFPELLQIHQCYLYRIHQMYY